MRSTRSSAAVAAVISTAATAVLIAGCSATPPSPSAQSTSPAAVDPAHDPAKKTSNRTLTADDSPLRKYLGWTYTSEDVDEEDAEFQNEEWAESDELLAACMKEQGFDYFPPPNTEPVIPSSDVTYDPGKDDVEYIKLNGYGIAIQADTVPEPPQDEASKYLAGLSDSERTAYDRAMEGQYANLSKEDPLAEEPWDWRKGGCRGTVSNQMYPEDADAAQRTYPTDEFQPLIDEALSIEQKAAESPEQKALEGKWSDCMAESGHSYETDYDAYWRLLQEFDEMGRPDPNEINNILWDTDSDEVKKFREKELDTALDSYECREKLHFADESLKIRFAMEEQFIKNHRAELDDYKAAEELVELNADKAMAERKAKRDKEKVATPKP